MIGYINKNKPGIEIPPSNVFVFMIISGIIIEFIVIMDG
jgi:hypothetical protein